jgi:hypothetical protein
MLCLRDGRVVARGVEIGSVGSYCNYQLGKH